MPGPAVQHAVLKLEDPLNRRRAAEEPVEDHRCVQVEAFVQAAQIEKGVEFVGAGVGHDYLQSREAAHHAREGPGADVLVVLRQSAGVDQEHLAVLLG